MDPWGRGREVSLIGLCGVARSGKSTVAAMLGEAMLSRGVRSHEVQIAGPLKRFTRDLFGWDEEHTDGVLKDIPDDRFPVPCPTCSSGDVVDCPGCKGMGIVHLTPRKVMQTLGYEWPLVLGAPTLHTNAAMVRCRELSLAGILPIVTDVRFLHDAEAVYWSGGFLVEVVRPGVGLGDHASETSRLEDGFRELITHTVINDGTLVELKSRVAELGLGLSRSIYFESGPTTCVEVDAVVDALEK